MPFISNFFDRELKLCLPEDGFKINLVLKKYYLNTLPETGDTNVNVHLSLRELILRLHH